MTLYYLIPLHGVMAQTKNLPGYYYRADASLWVRIGETLFSITFYAKEDSEDKLKIEVFNENDISCSYP